MTANQGLQVLGTADLSSKFFTFGHQSNDSENYDHQNMQVYVDPETLKHQKSSSLHILDDQVRMAKDRAASEYEMQRSSIILKADHDMKVTECTVKQAETQALFAIDQEFQQRRMEIEQKATEQRMQIESTASQLILTAHQQRMERDMQDRLSKLQGISNGASFVLPAWGFGSLQADTPSRN